MFCLIDAYDDSADAVREPNLSPWERSARKELSRVQLANSSERYGLVTKLLHWAIAFAIFGLIALGWYMVDLTYFDRWYNASLAWHKTLGMSVLGLGVVFVIWKFVSPSPRHPPSLGALQMLAATLAHYVLMTMMVLIPISGYLISTSAGKPVEIFTWFSIPALIEVDDRLRDIAITVHYWCAYGTGALALGHAGAAFKHQFIDRDGILARMIWR